MEVWGVGVGCGGRNPPSRWTSAERMRQLPKVMRQLPKVMGCVAGVNLVGKWGVARGKVEGNGVQMTEGV